MWWPRAASTGEGVPGVVLWWREGNPGGGSGLEGRGTWGNTLGQILTPGPGPSSLTRAVQICASKIADPNLSSPIGTAGV